MIETAIISCLLRNLAPLVKDEFSLLWNFRKEVKKLSSTLSSLHAVLEDAERKTLLEKDKQTEDWLRKLKHIAYEARDIMDECTFKDLRLQVKRLNASSSTRIKVTNYIVLPFHNTWTRHKIGHKIKDVQEKLDQISSERINLHLRESNNVLKSVTWRQTISTPSEKIYGREREEKEIVDILVHSSCVANEVSVLPILGPGGLGKTTLAQLVYNNENVAKHFNAKFWVCVSEEFDIKFIINAIIGTTSETSLEKLHNLIQDNLKGQKYLLVLDDVWNENVEQWKLLRSILDCGSNGAFILTTTRKKRVAEIMKTVEPFELSPISENDCWLLLKERAFMYGTPKLANFIDIGKEIAIKCNGVPLVAKTLGSQLGFKNDEKEWCRIRDCEMWEVSENEESILPILRLSYYDLPYDLRRCFTFCAIFPKDTEIEKKKLIQMWMAHELIPRNRNQDLEDNGNIIWDELCWRSFFQEEKLNWKGVLTCKMHDLMHDLAQSFMKDECYTMDAKSSSKDFEREIRHMTIMVEELNNVPLGSLENKGGLQSLILQTSSLIEIVKTNVSVLKELSSLRVFEVRGSLHSLSLRYVGGLKHLRYLNFSGNKMIKVLPNNICGLLNLQTLNLDHCSKLKCLPKNTKNLINLRHLHLKDCNGLKYMPRGMGQLRNLKTLTLFVIGKQLEGGGLDELKELDIRGYLKIKNLERISDASIKKGISMSKKSSINELELYWEDDTNNGKKKTRHEKISEALEVSIRGLKSLTTDGYKGVNIPKWVGESSASLMSLQLVEMENVQHIFTMNTSSSEIGMVELFPLLEYLHIKDMKNLRELVSPLVTTTITGSGAFPNLRTIVINNCRNLGALPAHLKSLKRVEVIRECCDELLDSIISNQSGLTHLCILSMGERSVLFPGANNDEALMIGEEEITSSSSSLAAENNEAQAGGPSTHFQSLRELTISYCWKLRSLFDEECEELAAASGERGRTRGGLITNLYYLDIVNCPELMISVEQWRNLITPSLQYLRIQNCPKLVPSKEEEAEQVIALLRSLRAKLDGGSGRFMVDF